MPAAWAAFGFPMPANVPSGAAIILCAIAIYFLARAIKWLQKRFS